MKRVARLAFHEHGGVRITPFDPHFEDALNAFERTRRKYRNALKELAK